MLQIMNHRNSWHLLTLAARLLLLLLSGRHGSRADLTDADEVEVLKIPWLFPYQAMESYRREFEAAERLGRNSEENPNRIIFYPENRVLSGNTVVVFCLLTPDRVNGYRTNSITLQILQEGYTHRRSLLAPIRKLENQADQLNCWNYAQESVCQPQRDCNSRDHPDLKTVGFITREGWGIFQLLGGKLTQAHYQCTSEMQSVLSPEEMTRKGLKEYVTIESDVMDLQVFDTSIGEPQLMLPPAFTRGEQISIRCKVANSNPGSVFAIDLVLMRPPPAGSPGEDRPELLASHPTPPEAAEGVLDWAGESALLSHHGLDVLCRVRGDWGERRGLRVAAGRLRVRFMSPAYLVNPRIRAEMSLIRARPERYYESPTGIKLNKAEYVVCKADGYPPPQILWTVQEKNFVWILNETMFISNQASERQPFEAICTASSAELNMTHRIKTAVRVLSGSARLTPSCLSGLLALLTWHLLRRSC